MRNLLVEVACISAMFIAADMWKMTTVETVVFAAGLAGLAVSWYTAGKTEGGRR